MADSSETLEEFKDSFSYGSRTDLSFKFLKRLTPDEAGEFFHQLLLEIGASFDHGDVSAIHDLVYEWQVRAYAPDPDAPAQWTYDDTPFTALAKPLAESRVGMLSSSGHFHARADPAPFGVADMSQDEAVARIGEFLKSTPELSVIPVDTPAADLRVRHGGYDIRGAAADHNVAFPRDALVAAAEEGRIGEVAPELYSFVGAAAQGRLRREAIPGWIDRIADARIDVLVLVPL